MISQRKFSAVRADSPQLARRLAIGFSRRVNCSSADASVAGRAALLGIR